MYNYAKGFTELCDPKVPTYYCILNPTDINTSNEINLIKLIAYFGKIA